MGTVITLLVIGIILLLAETILPGLIAGIVGFLCIVAGVVMSYLTFDLRTANLILFCVCLGLVAGFAGWVKYFPSSPLARLFVSTQQGGGLGVEQPHLLHQEGVAFTPLRPSGTAVINGKRVDVVTEGGMVAKGTPIKVMAIEGMRVVVRPIES